jgi:outer membrane biosynthesis protein TonB
MRGEVEIVMSAILAILLLGFSQTILFAQSSSSNSNRADERVVTRKAILKSKPAPDYPKEAEEYSVVAVVKLRMVLMSTGKVSNIEAVKVTVPDGTPDNLTDAFIRESVKAASKIKFDPAEKDGRKVSQYVHVEYNFKP